MNISNLDEARARTYRMSAVALVLLTCAALVGVFVGLYYSSPLITLASLVLTGVFMFAAFFAGGLGLSVVTRPGSRVIARQNEQRTARGATARGFSEMMERSESVEGARVDTEPPYMTDFPEENQPPGTQR
jgi:hypothetical protein